MPHEADSGPDLDIDAAIDQAETAAADDAKEASELEAQLLQFSEASPSEKPSASHRPQEGGEPQPQQRTQRHARPEDYPKEGEAGPHPAWQRVKGERDAAREEVTALRGQLGHMESRMSRMMEALADYMELQAGPAEPPAPGEQLPDFQEEPDRFIKRAVEDGVRPIAERLEEKERQQQEEQLEEAVSEVEEFHQADRKRFVEEHPEFEEAERFFFEKVYDYLVFTNPHASEDQIINYMRSEYIPDMRARYALIEQSGCEAIWETAKGWGWQPGANGQGEGQALPAALAPQANSAAGRIRQRMATGQGMGSVQPAAHPRVPTPQEVVDLPEDDFADAMEALSHGELKGLMSAFAEGSPGG